MSSHANGAPPTGCTRCLGDDTAAAWDAMHTARGASLLQESHFGIRLTACACGGQFAIVFTERVDWKDGDDDQDWLAVPITEDEATRLAACDEPALPSTLTDIARGRRFLVRSHPSGASMKLWWRDGGFMIGPHD